jgi:cysteine synthase A
VLNRSVPHEIVPVTDDESIAAARSLASKEGIVCGISSGGTFAAALKVAEKAPAGSVLAMLRTRERYPPLLFREQSRIDPEPDARPSSGGVQCGQVAGPAASFSSRHE